MRILFLSPYLPTPIRVRPYHWIRALAALGHEVHLLALVPPEDRPADESEMRRVCAGVHVYPLSRMQTLVNAALALPRPSLPLQAAYSHHAAAERQARVLVSRGGFDLVHVEHMRGAALASQIAGVPVVYDAVDSISALFASAAKNAPGAAQRAMARFDLGRSRRFESRVPFRFTRTLVTSTREAEALLALAGAGARERLTVVPNGVDTAYFHPRAPNGDAVVFTGKLSYHANAAAALRLVTRIMPRVWRARPATRVVIAGKGPSASVRQLATDRRVSVTGELPDVRAAWDRAAVAVCPLVYGAGIQNKVLEAMASGVATVMSVRAAEALQGVAGEDYLACEEDDAFAEAILGLLSSPEQRESIGRAGREYVCRAHDWRVMASALAGVYGEAIAAGPARGER